MSDERGAEKAEAQVAELRDALGGWYGAWLAMRDGKDGWSDRLNEAAAETESALDTHPEPPLLAEVRALRELAETVDSSINCLDADKDDIRAALAAVREARRERARP